jgi:hypothetical protein
MVKPDHVLYWMFFYWVWGCCVLHQSVSSKFEFVACLQGHMVKLEQSLSWNFDSIVWGCCVLHQSVSSIFESVACLQGLMVRLEQSLSWNFDLIVWGCNVLHQSVSWNFESEACFWAHKLVLELGLCWNFFEWRVEFLSLAPKVHTAGGGVLAPRPLQGPLRCSGRSLFFLCIFHPWGLINPHLEVASCLNF